MNLDINIGDILLGGRFKNKRIKVKSIGTDELGQPIINKGRKLLSVRIEKKLPEGMWSTKTLAEKYKDKDMNKKAFIQETYDSAFNDELEKLSASLSGRVLGHVGKALTFRGGVGHKIGGAAAYGAGLYGAGYMAKKVPAMNAYIPQADSK